MTNENQTIEQKAELNKAMRTQDEIVAKIAEVQPKDWMGTRVSDLIGYLDFAHAKPFLKPETVESDWEYKAPTRESILAEMLEYMNFAWDKANGCRGISAARSMDHYAIWVWMLGDEEIFGDLRDYEFYGKDNLVKICTHYGWDASAWDDNERTN